MLKTIQSAQTLLKINDKYNIQVESQCVLYLNFLLMKVHETKEINKGCTLGDSVTSLKTTKHTTDKLLFCRFSLTGTCST